MTGEAAAAMPIALIGLAQYLICCVMMVRGRDHPHRVNVWGGGALVSGMLIPGSLLLALL